MPGRMNVFLGTVLVGVLALSPAAAQQTSPTNDYLIVPGQRIGPVKLGANVKDVAFAFDLVDMVQIKDGKVVAMLWLSRGPTRGGTLNIFATPECANTLTFALPKCRILEAYITNDPEYVTAEGLHIGVLEKQVRGVLGEANRIIAEKDAHSLLYSSGILFYVSDKLGEDSQKVTGISVRPRNCLKDVPCI